MSKTNGIETDASLEDRAVHRRREKLLQLLAENGALKVADLIGLLGVSPATVRRDLSELEAVGRLTRKFGGAGPAKSSSLVEQTFQQKRELARAEKERIARLAAGLVQPGMAVVLDSGTTMWRLAAALKDKAPLVVLTSSLAVVEELANVNGIQIRVTGGRFRGENLDFVGPEAVAAFGRFHADMAFLGGDSFIVGSGLYASDEASAEVTVAIAGCSAQVVGVVDHTKFASRACYRVLPCEEFDCVVSDSGLNEETTALMRAGPFKLLIAD